MSPASSAKSRLRIRAGRAGIVPLLLLLVASRLFADGEPAGITVSSALSRGAFRELVFEGDSILSELVWPMDNAVSLGLEADVPLRSRVRLRAALGVALPMRTGSMTDADFMNLPVSDEQTHYSRHDASLLHSVTVALSLFRPWETGLPGPLTGRRITVTPEIGARYSSRAWSARDGYIQYGEYSGGMYEPWTPALPIVPLSGTVITYRLTSLSVSGRLSVLVPVASRWEFMIGVSGGPILSATGLDEHLLRSLTFKDMMSGGWFFEPSAGLSFSTGPRSALSLVVLWEKTGNLRGDTNIYEDGVPGYLTVPNGGGGDSSVVTVRLGYSVRLGPRAGEAGPTAD